jgi:hypothetical protein
MDSLWTARNGLEVHNSQPTKQEELNNNKKN